jgi:hypothetical protein
MCRCRALWPTAFLAASLAGATPPQTTPGRASAVVVEGRWAVRSVSWEHPSGGAMTTTDQSSAWDYYELSFDRSKATLERFVAESCPAARAKNA